MRLMFVFAAALSLLPAETVSKGDRDHAMSYLHATRKMFLDSLAGLSPAQWTYKPAADRWSIAECAEHIAVTEDALFTRITQKIVASPVASAAQRAETKGKDEKVLAVIPDRSDKRKAPEAIQPKGRWKTVADLTAHFKQTRDRTIAWIESTQDDLRAHVDTHPSVGPIDAYQWILLVSAHSERHLRQIEEVKASPGFPKK
jgi:uncharacterized damage-inducible protein DinB